MAYEAPITIKKAIDNIQKKQYVLPSIQREFVWDTDQIEKLFDSLMRDYPISTFLFWKVEKHRIKDFQFYEFLKNYHEKDARHNLKADLSHEEDVISILDGQQRMTSMFLALTGTYASKMPYYRWDSPNAFPKRKLYLNLLRKSEEIEMEYDFQFLTDEEAAESETQYWFPTQQIMELNDMSKVSKYLSKNDLMDSSRYTEEERDFAIDTLNQFFNVIHQKGSISYFLEEGEELDKVLQIFIRINSGGTKLSYSDLLLSIATAEWKEKDAREVIHEFVDEINNIGDGFKFNKDFVLKSCLVLADFANIKFKVDNFTKENMIVIEKNWSKSASAVRSAVRLVSKFGYNRDNLMATTAVIPIAYFIFRNELGDAVLHSSSQTENRANIKEWLARVFLKGTFGGTPDTIYPVMRNLVNDNIGSFPLKKMIEYYRGKRRSISFTDDDIDNILELEYGKPRTYCALTLLYPSLNYNFKYHQDHIHPKSFFDKKALSKMGIKDDDQREAYVSRVNKISNLQLLQATENIEKTNTPFKEWVQSVYLNEADQKAFLSQHFINADVSLDFYNFVDFSEQRRALLKKLFEKILGVVPNLVTST